MKTMHLPAFMDWHWLWLTVAAFLAGVLNAVAGGGSFLLFPALLSMKILPVQANATNTVALWPGQLTSIAAYRDDIRKNLRLAIPMGLAGLLGGTAGAVVLLNTPQMPARSRAGLSTENSPSQPARIRRAACRSSWPPSLSASTSATLAPAPAFS